MAYIIFPKSTSAWSSSPTQNFQHINRYSRNHPKLRRLNFFVGMLLKFREFSNHDGSVAVFQTSGLTQSQMRVHLSHWLRIFKNERFGLESALPLQMVINLDRNNALHPNTVADLLQTSHTQNISILWENNTRPFKEDWLLPYDDRSTGENKNLNFGQPLRTFYDENLLKMLCGNPPNLPAVCIARANSFIKSQDPEKQLWQ